MLSGTTSRVETCRPVWSRTSAACAPESTAVPDFGEVRLHRLAIGRGHDESGAIAGLRAGRAEDVGHLVR